MARILRNVKEWLSRYKPYAICQMCLIKGYQNHDAHEAFFGHCQEQRMALARASTSSSSMKRVEETQWGQQSEKFRAGLLYLSEDRKWSNPWSKKARLQGLSSTQRVRELLDCCYLYHESLLVHQAGQMPSESQVIQGLVIDVSQAVQRKPWTRGGPCRTFCTGSETYSFEADRILLPEEELALLGFPPGLLSGITLSEGYELVGQSMAICSVGLGQAVLLSAAIKAGALSDLVILS